MKKRIAWLDLVKLFTIYLVILGHVTVKMVNGFAVGVRLSHFVCSFHMPLFMLLCGYFVSARAMQGSFTKLLYIKAKQLLLPSVTCAAICCIYLYLARNCVSFRDEIIGNSWFLKVLFVYYVIFYLLKHTRINDEIILPLSCLLLFVIPGGATLQINHLWPFFVCGYLLRKYSVLDKFAFSWGYAIGFVLLFIVSYSLQRNWGIPNYIPINIETLYGQWYIILLRYVVGISGSLATIALISILYKYFGTSSMLLSKIAKYGQWTLGVYVLQTILVINVFPDTLAWYVESEVMLDLVVAPMLSIVCLLLCLYIIHLFSKNKILDLLMFGGQYYKK
jgi:fucose 4-O-acetylase-like acetyltransferase